MSRIYDSAHLYNLFSKSYREYSLLRKNYIDAINLLIIKYSMKKRLNNMLDIGSANGMRAVYLFKKTNAKKLWLIDNSKEMIKMCKTINKSNSILLDVTKDDLLRLKASFDLVTCLWNVLGHIDTCDERLNALKNISGVMNKNSLLFIDLNNRYNISAYGFMNVLRNIWLDMFDKNNSNGNFIHKISIAKNRQIATKVHIFSYFEIIRLLRESQLKLVKMMFINYETGKITNFFQGQFFLVIKK